MYCISSAQSLDSLYFQEARQLELLFEQDELMLEEDSLIIPMRKTQYNVPYQHNRVYSTCSNDSLLKILIIVDDYVYSRISEKIIRYARDLYCGTSQHSVIESVSNATKLNIKDLIISYSNNIEGLVLIGNLDFAIFEQTYTNNKNESSYLTWPCELFYSDLDGIWEDIDNNGLYDTHSGNKDPELIIGRLPIINNNEKELNLLKNFFDKNHRYWIGDIEVKEQKSLDYRNKDWINESTFDSIKKLYGSDKYDYFQTCDGTFGADDYSNRLISGEYEFIQLAAHSSPRSHTFNLCNNKKEVLNSSAIEDLDKQVLGYNLFCCSACNWSVVSNINELLAGAYIYSSGKTLSLVGSTKTGSMLYFDPFYTSLSQNNSIGQSLKDWWLMAPFKGESSYSTFIYWFYGLCIIGDPFVSFKYNTNNTCTNILRVSNYEATSSNIIYYRAKEKIIVDADFKNVKDKHFVFDAPIVIFANGFYLPKGSSMEVLQEGCNCNHIN